MTKQIIKPASELEQLGIGLVELGLVGSDPAKHTSRKATAKASDMARRRIDKIGDPSATAEERKTESGVSLKGHANFGKCAASSRSRRADPDRASRSPHRGLRPIAISFPVVIFASRMSRRRFINGLAATWRPIAPPSGNKARSKWGHESRNLGHAAFAESTA
jgi:hypothetical protein